MRSRIIFSILFASLVLFTLAGKCQAPGIYPPFTKWYQDPLGAKPLELSSAFGFLWASAGVVACLIFTKDNPARQKRTSAYQESGLEFGYKAPYTRVIHNEIGLMYDVRKWMSLGMGWNAIHFSDKTNDTWSFGFRPFVRWYPYKSKKAAIFFEYGAGVSCSLDQFPLTGTGWKADTARTGTRFNFTSKYGIGTEINLDDRFSLHGGIRHFHLSNGNIEGIKRNPSHDSNGFFIGMIYKLKSKRPVGKIEK
ncbi:MAG TPA: acyloxyacyl hydrolase [Chitinophagaceae bacterium]